MVSPNLIKKSESFLNVSPGTKKLFQLVYGQKKKGEIQFDDDDTPRIHVSRIVSRLSFFYEKIRQAVDYDDDHLLRKNATKRILKRYIFIEGVVMDYDSEDISLKLLTELIQAGYLPNNRVPEVKIHEVALLLDKYIKLRDYFKRNYAPNFDLSGRETEEKKRLNDWIMTLAATEIEENLGHDDVKQLIVANIFEALQRVIKMPPDLPYQNDLEIQIYLSICRNYLKLDHEMLSYFVFKYYNNWEEATETDIAQVAVNLKAIQAATEYQLKHPLIKQIDKIVRRYTLYYTILFEVISDNPTKSYENAVSNTKAFVSSIREKCSKTYFKVKNKLWMAGVRSIIYILLTKSVFVVALEVPMIKFFGEPVNPVSLAVNISFPAVLLFIMILFTKTPDNKNTDKIIEGIKEITFVENKKTQPIVLRRPTRRGSIINVFFNLVYSAAFLLVIYWLIKLLTFVRFNWVSITIFLFFLMFVSFFSFRIKRDVKQYVITDERETLLGFIFDLFYMPIVAVGKFMSDNISKINVFVFALDFIIETPFKVIVGIIEEWTKYLKERKEDLG